ncbi:MAG TPA: hypothetical protein PJ994_03535 [Tepidiformaceae bacterium]|nr:hypothetical protein [Tepidiformaceae bacterium]
MLSEFGDALWFGGQGAVAGLLGVLYVKRSGWLLQHEWAGLAVALLVALTATACLLALGIVLDLPWLRPDAFFAVMAAWFGTRAILAPEPEKPRIQGPIGPASRAFEAYKQRPVVWTPPEHDRW